MKAYLQHAVVFEKNVYIWSHAMNEANARVQHLYSERKRLEALKNAAHGALSALKDSKPSDDAAIKKQKESDALKYRAKAKISMIIAVITLLVLFGIGCGIGWQLLNDPSEPFHISKIIFIPVMGFVMMIIGALFTGVVPICILVFASSKAKSVNLQNELNSSSKEASLERQKSILEAQESEADNDWAVNVIEESVLNEKQEEIHTQLKIAQSNLHQIYSHNVLPAKYRNLNAVATLFEYLNTGRCNTIQGHGGIYDTYETERVQLAQLEQLVRMNRTLVRIEDNQRQICHEIRQANQTLSGIKSHLSEIEKTNAEIAHNTAISAAANQQTAAATQWLAWNAWANGY